MKQTKKVETLFWRFLNLSSGIKNEVQQQKYKKINSSEKKNMAVLPLIDLLWQIKDEMKSNRY